MVDFTHLDKEGRAKMVDISGKSETLRTAKARGSIILNKEILEKIKSRIIKKGDVLTVAKIAGINAAKKTWETIPLCHQIKITDVDMDFEIIDFEKKVIVTSTVTGFDRTGVEMEALHAVTIGLLTIYDMCKALSKKIIIGEIKLIKKTGGRSEYQKSQ